MNLSAEIKATPKQMAIEFWNMGSDEQALFYQELYNLAGGHKLVLQGLMIREDCKKLSNEALDGFQYLSSCSYQWFECYQEAI